MLISEEAGSFGSSPSWSYRQLGLSEVGAGRQAQVPAKTVQLLPTEPLFSPSDFNFYREVPVLIHPSFTLGS